MSVLIVDWPGLADHVRQSTPFLPGDVQERLVSKLIPYWEKEVARRTGPTWYLPVEEDFVDVLEALYAGSQENLILLTSMDNLAPAGSVLDLFTPAADFLNVERWTTAAAKRVCGLDPRWYREYRQSEEKIEAKRKREAMNSYRQGGERWKFLARTRMDVLPLSSVCGRTPNRLLNVEGAVYTPVITEDDLDELVDVLSSCREFAFDDETTGLHPIDADLVGVSAACDAGRAYYIPVGHKDGEQLPRWRVMERLRPLFESEEVGKIGHKVPFDILFIETHSDTRVRNVVGDTKTLAWMLGYGATIAATRDIDGEKLGLKTLAAVKLGIHMMDFKTTTAGREDASDTPIDKMTPYAAADSDMTFRLHPMLLAELEKMSPALVRRYYEMELPFLRTVLNMERRGVFIDAATVQQLANEYTNEAFQIEEQLKGITRNEAFNPNSPRQVGDYLFKELHLPPIGGRTKTGYKADAKTLEQLRPMHPVVDMLMEWKSIMTLKSRYTEPLPGMISPVTGRVHGLISATGTGTGRIAMAQPNLTNIPVRTERGAKLRYAIQGQGDNYLLDIDYSQIEPRVLAHLSGDPFLIETFERGIDLYRAIGARAFNCQIEDVTDKQRRALKMAWLAATYLVGAEKLAGQLTLALNERWSTQDARDFLDTFFSVVTHVRPYQNQQIAFVQKHGYAETMMGFRMPVPGINSPVPEIRAHAHSQAVNLPIQGTASGDIVKSAMNALDALGDAIPMMILQIHDELIFEGPREQLEDSAPVIQRVLENITQLCVPLEAKPAIAKTWGDAKG